MTIHLIDLPIDETSQMRKKMFFIPEAEGLIGESLLLSIGLDGEGSTTCLNRHKVKNSGIKLMQLELQGPN